VHVIAMRDDDRAIGNGACRCRRGPAGERANLAGDCRGHVCPIVGALNGRSGRLDRPGEYGEHCDVPVAFQMEDVVPMCPEQTY
jgi:hypothetical protein